MRAAESTDFWSNLRTAKYFSWLFPVTIPGGLTRSKGAYPAKFGAVYTVDESLNRLAPDVADDFWVEASFRFTFQCVSTDGVYPVTLSVGPPMLRGERKLKKVFLGIGNAAFDVEMAELENDGLVVSRFISAGLDSGFAIAHPLFTLAQKSGIALISTSHAAVKACASSEGFAYHPVVYVKGAWATAGRVQVGFESRAVSMLVANVLPFGLDSDSWKSFWEQLYAESGMEEGDFEKDDIGRMAASDRCTLAQVAKFPRLALDIGAFTLTLSPAEYVTGMPGSTECRVEIVDSGSGLVILGEAFFRNTIVQFDNVNRRLGFCRAASL